MKKGSGVNTEKVSIASVSLSLPSICLSTLDCVPLEIYTGVQLVSWRFVVYIYSVFVQTKVVAE